MFAVAKIRFFRLSGKKTGTFWGSVAVVAVVAVILKPITATLHPLFRGRVFQSVIWRRVFFNGLLFLIFYLYIFIYIYINIYKYLLN